MTIKRVIKFCDNCGKKNPQTFPRSRITVCCSTYDIEHKNAFYGTVDAEGVKVYGMGKMSTETKFLTFPLVWRGFWN